MCSLLFLNVICVESQEIFQEAKYLHRIRQKTSTLQGRNRMKVLSCCREKENLRPYICVAFIVSCFSTKRAKTWINQDERLRPHEPLSCYLHQLVAYAAGRRLTVPLHTYVHLSVTPYVLCRRGCRLVVWVHMNQQARNVFVCLSVVQMRFDTDESILCIFPSRLELMWNVYDL